MAVGGEVAGRRRRWLSWRRLLALFAIAVVVVVVLVWVVVPYVQELFKYEQLTLHDYWWTRNEEGNISMVTLHLQNNGTKTLTISDVFVNQTHVEPTRWDSTNEILPSEFWSWMYVAPQSLVFEEGSAYNLTVGTEAGNSFSYLVKVLPDDVAEEEAGIQSAIFFPSEYSIYCGNFVGVYVGNNGTVPVIVVEGWCNGTQYNITKTWVWTGEVGGTARGVGFQLTWNAGETYNFMLKTASGNTYNYSREAG